MNFIWNKVTLKEYFDHKQFSKERKMKSSALVLRPKICTKFKTSNLESFEEKVQETMKQTSSYS